MLLRGDLVGLRALEPDDAAAVHRWHSDPEVMRWMHDPYPGSLEQVVRELAEAPPNGHASLTLVVVDPDGRAVGLVALRGEEPEAGAAELDVYLGERDAWGRGYATDAVRTVCRYAFAKMRLHRVGLSVAVGNDAARRVYDKVGFVEEGRRRECFWRDGAWADEVLMGLLAHELR